MTRALTLLCMVALWLAACSGLSGEPRIVSTFAPDPPPQASPSDWRPDISNGAQIFAQRCADCHGVAGDGRGELALAGSLPPPPDMTDLAVRAGRSPLAYYDIITDGNIDALMPPWRDALSERERWDVALYSYTLAYDDALLGAGQAIWQEGCADCERPAQIPPIYSDSDYGLALNQADFAGALSADEMAAAVAFARMQSLLQSEREPAIPRGPVRGSVVHGSAGGTTPAELPVQLQYGNDEAGFSVLETTIDQAGSFVFDDIPLTRDYGYLVGAVYERRFFSARLMAGRAADDSYDLKITLYDQTDDPTLISVASIDMLFSAVRLEGLGAGLIVSQRIGYRNRSDRLYTSGRGFDDGREASLLIQFPAGARILSGDENGRYVIVEDLERVPDSIIDTLPLPPGQAHEVIVDFYLPYRDGMIYEQKFNNLLDAEVRVSLPRSMSLPGDWLRPQAPDANDQARVYAGALTRDSDARLRFQIAGNPFATSSDDPRVLTSETLLPALLGLMAALAAVTGGLALRRRRKPDNAPELDSLLRQIAQLDRQHDRGQINHDLYHRRRKELRSQLAALLPEGESEP